MAFITMGFTYYFMKTIKIVFIILGMTNLSIVLFYSLISGFLEQSILGFEMSTPSAICFGGMLLILFGYSLNLIYQEVVDIIKTKIWWDSLDELIEEDKNK